MSRVRVEAQVEEGLRPAVTAAEVEALVVFVLTEEGVADAELSVTLLSDPGIEALNREYLGHEGPTDVISFALPGPGEQVVGDVYLGTEQAGRQAAELGEDARTELLRLAAHGTLHVLGYDHPEGEAGRAESPMYRRQEALLSAFLASRR